MEEKKRVLIVCDESASTQRIAAVISIALGAQETVMLPAESFSGTHLLPTDALFLGCSEPRPSSFLYIEDLFQHINLAGRPCGVFSSDRKALKYLSALIKASEVVSGKPLFVKNAAADSTVVQKWIQGILK